MSVKCAPLSIFIGGCRIKFDIFYNFQIFLVQTVKTASITAN
jgi:hypothetical protein